MSSFANPDRIAKILARAVLPPEPTTVSELALGEMRVEESGGHTAAWSLVPYMIEPMNRLKSREHRAVVFLGPSRSGKTQALIDCWLLHTILVDPGDFGVYLPTRDLMRDYSRRRVSRMNRNCRRAGELVGTERFDATLDMILYRHGMILTLGWPSTGQLAQRDMRSVALSDYDSFPEEIGQEGSPFEMAAKRVTTAMSGGMIMAETSPKRLRSGAEWRLNETNKAPAVDGGLTPIYNDGTRAIWHFRCIDGCGESFPAPFIAEYEAAENPLKTAASAYVACPHCGAKYLPKEKKRLNESGRWIHATSSDIASYWLPGCAAFFQDWGEVCAKHLAAKKAFDASGDEARLKAVHNMDMCLPYRPAALGESMHGEFLSVRRESSMRRFHIPDGVRVVFAAVDVQANRFEIAVIGHGRHNERWLLDRFALKRMPDNTALSPAAYLEHWAVLIPRVIEAKYTRSDGSPMTVLATAIDSGGQAGTTERAYEFWRGLRERDLARRTFLVKGVGYASAPISKRAFPDSPVKSRPGGGSGDVPVLLINVNRIKDMLYADLQRHETGPGYVHFPEWIPDSVFSELTAEKRTPAGWKNESGARNETWDLFCYDRALWHFLGGDSVDWDRPPEWLSGQQPEPEEEKQEKRPRPRRNFVTDWR